MTISFVLSLLVQGLCLGLFFQVFRRSVLQRTGCFFLVMVCLYHGFGDFLLRVFTGYAWTYRALVDSDTVDRYAAWITASVAAYTACYLLAVRCRKPFHFQTELLVKTNRILASSCVPLCLLFGFAFATLLMLQITIEQLVSGPVYTGYWLYSLASSMWYQLWMLSALGLAATRSKWFSPILIAGYSLPVIALLGNRLSLVFLPGAFLLVLAPACGFKITLKHVCSAVVTFVVGMAVISAMRYNVGRDAFSEADALGKVAAYKTVVTDLSASELIVAVAEDTVYRLDGNSYGAMILAELEAGMEPVWLATWSNDLLMMVPRAWQPNKLDKDSMFRDYKVFLSLHFGMKADLDYLCCWMGYLLGSFGTYGLVISMALLGLLFAKLDDWFMSSSSVSATAAYFVLVMAILYYEQVLMVLLATARSFVMVCALVWVARAATRFARRGGST